MEYAVAEWRDKFRIASENPAKDDLVALLLERHDGPDDRVLVIGQYLKQLRRIAERFDLPLITGADPERRARGPLRPVPHAASSAAWSCRRSATSPSTCPTPT